MLMLTNGSLLVYYVYFNLFYLTARLKALGFTNESAAMGTHLSVKNTKEKLSLKIL